MDANYGTLDSEAGLNNLEFTILVGLGSFMAGLAFRNRFKGDGIVFYLMIGSLVAPGDSTRTGSGHAL